MTAVATKPTPSAKVPRASPPPIGLGFLVHDVARLLRRRFEHKAREAGLELGRTEAAVLLTIARQQGASQATLAQLLDIEPITLAHVLARLEARGFVERRPHPTDRRIRTVWLPQEAEPMLARIREVTRAVREEALAGFAGPEQRAVMGALLGIRENLLRRPGTGGDALPAPWRALTGLVPEIAE